MLNNNVIIIEGQTQGGLRVNFPWNIRKMFKNQLSDLQIYLSVNPGPRIRIEYKFLRSPKSGKS